MTYTAVFDRSEGDKDRREAVRRAWSLCALVSVLFLCAVGTVATRPQDKWQLAAQRIKRLSPAAFSNLPAGFRKRLEARGCLVPQSFGQPEPHNVIYGELARRGQTDWAALCSRNGKSRILVFWGGPASCSNELAVQDDSVYLQGTEKEIEYSRHLGLVDERFIRIHYEAYGGTKPPDVVDHLGIDDRFLEKASVVHYCHQGKWLRLQGAD